MAAKPSAKYRSVRGGVTRDVRKVPKGPRNPSRPTLKAR